jgi:antitoxin (DNA-binding transcriptional repressor) of toxin-antitoxin stability system
MRRMGIRELRNETASAVRRAMGGERIVITISGMPAAQLGPLNQGESDATLDDLAAAGLVRAPRRRDHRPPPPPVQLPPGPTLGDVVLGGREE